MNFKNPLKSKTKDINSQSKANKYTFVLANKVSLNAVCLNAVGF